MYTSNKALRRSSPIILRKSVFICRKAEFALSTLALVAVVVRRMPKTRVTLGKISFVFFVIKYLRVSEVVVRMFFSLGQFCFRK